jgi:hypothetical protein
VLLFQISESKAPCLTGSQPKARFRVEMVTHSYQWGGDKLNNNLKSNLIWIWKRERKRRKKQSEIWAPLNLCLLPFGIVWPSYKWIGCTRLGILRFGLGVISMQIQWANMRRQVSPTPARANVQTAWADAGFCPNKCTLPLVSIELLVLHAI